jgi:hypothetical protein
MRVLAETMVDIPYLPAEIHRLIAQYVHREDLPRYRLANRQSCALGTEELFGTIVFHYSTASIHRLEELSASERLRACVKTIFWDVNIWKIPRVRDLNEWHRYFTMKAAFCRSLQLRNLVSIYDVIDASGYDELAENRTEWEEYLDKMEDEKRARKASKQLHALGRFQNLQSVRIVNGELCPAHRGLKKVADRFSSAPPAPAILRRGEEGLTESHRHDRHTQPGIEAFQTIQRYCNSSLRKLKFDSIHPQALTALSSRNFESLTSLDVKITEWLTGFHLGSEQPTSLQMQALRGFLARTTQLECLRVGANSNMQVIGDLSRVQHVFGSEFTWSKLRKLSLCQFTATPDALLSLVERHNSTLKDLRLRDISWQTDEEANVPEEELEADSPSTPPYPSPASWRSIQHCAWPRVLRKMSMDLSLDRATISGMLGEGGTVLGWQLDKNQKLAAAVSGYLISGGQCPLTADNAHFAIDNCKLAPISIASQ